MTPRFFKSPADLRRWLERNHAGTTELWVGFYKVGSGRASVTYKKALDEALCFGWIDGVRKGRDEESYVQRFTPRRPRSYWSDVNTRRAQELIAAGQMHPAGLAAFERRDAGATARYAFEGAAVALDPEFEARFRKNASAWAQFEKEAPWYRRVATHWVMSAKREDTRVRRLTTLIQDSAAGRRIGPVPEKAR